MQVPGLARKGCRKVKPQSAELLMAKLTRQEMMPAELLMAELIQREMLPAVFLLAGLTQMKPLCRMLKILQLMALHSSQDSRA